VLSGLVPPENQAAAHKARTNEIPVAEFGASERRVAQPVKRRGR
jgi:hypothetical protein